MAYHIGTLAYLYGHPSEFLLISDQAKVRQTAYQEGLAIAPAIRTFHSNHTVSKLVELGERCDIDFSCLQIRFQQFHQSTRNSWENRLRILRFSASFSKTLDVHCTSLQIHKTKYLYARKQFISRNLLMIPVPKFLWPHRILRKQA